MPKILLIDDNLFFLDVLGGKLKSEGYEVVTAVNGEEGIEKYKSEKPDLVITDIIMPVKDGTETIRDLKRLNNNAKIIAITAGGALGDHLEIAEEFGADATFLKPFDYLEFMSTIKKLLQ